LLLKGHLAGSFAHHRLEHVVGRWDWRSRWQNLIRFRHGVTLLKLARATELV
jgi:hypothetical protein